jgi:ParB family chromosome partitioning protein
VSAPSKPKVGLPPNRRMRHDRHYVDELAQRMGEGIGRMIRITSIASNQDQPRTNLGDLSDLETSINIHGVLEPLLVRRLDDGDYELVSGERRFHAAMAVGLAEVPCIELAVSDEEALEIALIENLQRKDLSAFEEGEGYRTLMNKYGYSHEQVAEAVARSRVTVTETLRLLSIPSAIRDLCRHADINAKGILLEIAKAPDEEAQARLVQEIVEYRLDRAELRQRRRELAETFDQDASQTPDDGKKTRPFIVRFQRPDRNFTVSLSFRTEEEPETESVIEALREMIRELEADLKKDPS